MQDISISEYIWGKFGLSIASPENLYEIERLIHHYTGIHVKARIADSDSALQIVPVEDIDFDEFVSIMTRPRPLTPKYFTNELGS